MILVIVTNHELADIVIAVYYDQTEQGLAQNACQNELTHLRNLD